MTCRTLGRWLIVGLLASLACAHDIHTRMEEEDAALTGRLDIVFTGTAGDVTIVVERRLVVNRAKTSRVVIDNVPAGVVEVIIACGQGMGRVERMQRVDVEIGETTTIPVAAPSGSAWREVPSTAMMLLIGAIIKIGMLVLL